MQPCRYARSPTRSPTRTHLGKILTLSLVETPFYQTLPPKIISLLADGHMSAFLAEIVLAYKP